MTTISEEDRRFLETYDDTRYEKHSVAVDVVILTVREKRLHVLLHRRSNRPFQGRWALPGGFLRKGEDMAAAAEGALRRKAGVDAEYLEQLYTFGGVDRDPRTRVISVAYYALLPTSKLSLRDDSLRFALVHVPWEGEAGGPAQARKENGESLALAFDHERILGMAVQRIRGKLDYSPIGYAMLPPHFTLRELQEVHETILDRKLNKASFRRRLLASKQLLPIGRKELSVGHRPAALYRWKEDE